MIRRRRTDLFACCQTRTVGGVLSDEQIERLARETGPVDCTASSGAVVAMRPLTVHASSKSIDSQPRRVLHIEYAATVHLAATVELAVV